MDGNRSPTTVRNTSPNSIAPRTQLQSRPVIFSFLFLLYYDYIKFFFSRLILSLTWMIFVRDWCLFFSNWWRNQQLRSFCNDFGHNLLWWKNWLPINFDIGARSTLNLQYHCIDGYMWTCIVVVWDIDIDGERDWHSIIEIATRRFYKYPIASVEVHWRQLVNFISHLGISETLILLKKDAP